MKYIGDGEMNLSSLVNGFASFGFSSLILMSESRVVEIICILGLAINFISISRVNN